MTTARTEELKRVTVWLTQAEKTDWETKASKYASMADMIRTAVRSFLAGLNAFSPQQNQELSRILEELREIHQQNRRDAADLQFYRESVGSITAPQDLMQKVRLMVTHGRFTTGEVAFITGITREETVLILSAMKDLTQDEQTARWQLKNA